MYVFNINNSNLLWTYQNLTQRRRVSGSSDDTAEEQTHCEGEVHVSPSSESHRLLGRHRLTFNAMKRLDVRFCRATQLEPSHHSLSLPFTLYPQQIAEPFVPD
ncbi:hypothetical protein PC128_g10429 [Phytophthora cactorum]|nr:hypothetical protein PC128_g10429 [Phytophthora cactorum]